jgi:hypothetical protein
MYIGHGLFIHAPHTGTVVSVNSLSGTYGSGYVGAVRLHGTQQPLRARVARRPAAVRQAAPRARHARRGGFVRPAADLWSAEAFGTGAA